jgi:predicted transcriptional regulator
MAVKQNLTVQLDREIIRKAKILAARRGTSVSGFIASQIRESVEMDDAYEAARRSALELLQQGFHMGGGRVDRDALHER